MNVLTRLISCIPLIGLSWVVGGALPSKLGTFEQFLRVYQRIWLPVGEVDHPILHTR
jgi:hypothetical protein